MKSAVFPQYMFFMFLTLITPLLSHSYALCPQAPQVGFVNLQMACYLLCYHFDDSGIFMYNVMSTSKLKN